MAADKRLTSALLVHLSVLEKHHQVDTWTEQRILPGKEWRIEINLALKNAHAAILLVSPAFLASDFIHEVEMPRIINDHKSRGLIMFPVLLRQCAWNAHPVLSNLTFLPRHDKPIASTRGGKRDETLTQITHEILSIISRHGETTNRSTEHASYARNQAGAWRRRNIGTVQV